jgi:hypothetical protein
MSGKIGGYRHAFRTIVMKNSTSTISMQKLKRFKIQIKEGADPKLFVLYGYCKFRRRFE